MCPSAAATAAKTAKASTLGLATIGAPALDAAAATDALEVLSAADRKERKHVAFSFPFPTFFQSASYTLESELAAAAWGVCGLRRR